MVMLLLRISTQFRISTYVQVVTIPCRVSGLKPLPTSFVLLRGGGRLRLTSPSVRFTCRVYNSPQFKHTGECRVCAPGASLLLSGTKWVMTFAWQPAMSASVGVGTHPMQDMNVQSPWQRSRGAKVRASERESSAAGVSEVRSMQASVNNSGYL